MIPDFLNRSIPARTAGRLVRALLLIMLVYVGVSYNTQMSLVFFLGVTTGAVAFVALGRTAEPKRE